MKIFNKKLSFYFICLFSLLVSSCFDIVHYIQQENNGSLKVKWIFSISSAFNINPADPNQPSLKQKINTGEQELKNKLKEIVEEFQYKLIENEYEIGVQLEFTVKDLSKVKQIDKVFEEGFPVLPIWKAKKKQLVFQFRNKDNSLTPTKEELSENSENPSQEEDPSKKIAKMIMSSASYRVVLGNNFIPKKVFIENPNSNKKQNLDFIQVGDQTHIRVPFMSLLMENEKGFDLIVQM